LSTSTQSNFLLPDLFLNKTTGAESAPGKIVIMSDLALKKHGLDNVFDIKTVRTTAANNLCKGYTTGSASLRLRQQHKHISFGCSNLDEITNGGLPMRGITEISGEAGSGKSQICMQLALTVQLPKSLGGLGKQAAYISTDNGFPIRRLKKILKPFSEICELSEEQMFENIFVQEIRDTQSLMNTIAYRLPLLCAEHNIGLVIVDSIASPLRIETDYIDRANKMRIMVRNLLNLSRLHACAIVCVNQVTSNDDVVMPSLGLAWANLVNTRIKLSKATVGSNCSDHSIRNFEVTSSELAHARTKFAITSQGINNPS
jgi:DNA-repair protein XRCC3